jgi:dTDP-4-dehydrorhamnose 3,5-epimerase
MRLGGGADLLPGMFLLEPTVYKDSRGEFFEAWNRRDFSRLTKVQADFVQDNRSVSSHHVLRGLHYQIGRPQGKLVSVIRGVIFDVAVDLRQSSPTFAQWCGVELSEHNRLHLWVPPGFAHGFIVRSGSAEVSYKTTDYYAPELERCLLWNDPTLGIKWDIFDPVLSDKDRAGALLKEAEVYR